MVKNTLESFLKKNGITDTAIIEAYHALVEPVNFSKHTPIFHQGDKLQYVYFLSEGIVRYVTYTFDDREVTKSIRVGPNIVSSTYSMATGGAAPFSAEPLQDTTLYAMKIKDWHALVDQYNDFAKFYIKLLEDRFIEKELHELSLLHETPEQRYTNFQKKYAPHLDKMPQWMIASALGITPEALSRLKKRANS